MSGVSRRPVAGFMFKKYYLVIICLILAIIFRGNVFLFWIFLILAFMAWYKTRPTQVNKKQTVTKQFLGKKPSSWSSRHSILTAILIVFGFILLINMINAPSSPNQDNSLPIPSYHPTRQLETPTPTPRIIKKVTKSPIPTYQAPTSIPTPIYTPPPTPTPLIVKSWHTITQFSGSGSKNTDQFTVQGTQWRITWTAYATKSYCLASGCSIYIYTYKPGDTIYTDNMISEVSGSKTDTANFYNNGTFYFKIINSNVDSWSITVEDFY